MLECKRNNKYNHELTYTHLGVNNQNSYQQGENIIKLVDEKYYLQSNKHKKNSKTWHCETCKRDINNITESSHIKSNTHMENEVISRINNNLTEKAYIFFNPEIDKIDGTVKKVVDG